jgi:hypothetical protein
VPATLARRIGKIAVDVEERRARDVAFEVETAAGIGIAELPAAVDEPVPHAATLTLDGAAARYASAVAGTPVGAGSGRCA